jgi:HrpA-like RNA helicase
VLYLQNEQLGDITSLELLDPIPACSLAATIEVLIDLNLVKFTDGAPDLTPDGKLADRMPDEIDPQSTCMILAARRFGCMNMAIQLAAMMAVAHDLVLPSKDDSVREARALLHDDMGDHFTLINIYNTFEQVRRTQTVGQVKRWCARHGYSYWTMCQAQRVNDSAYRTLKSSRIQGTLAGNDVTALCQALLSGYFRNVAVLHDEQHVEAGYSMLTGHCVDGKVQLPKLSLRRDSDLLMQGDLVENTWLVCGSIRYRQSSYEIQTACRVKREWVLEHTPEAWRKRVGLSNAGGPHNALRKVVRERVGKACSGNFWSTRMAVALLCKPLKL